MTKEQLETKSLGELAAMAGGRITKLHKRIATVSGKSGLITVCSFEGKTYWTMALRKQLVEKLAK